MSAKFWEMLKQSKVQDDILNLSPFATQSLMGEGEAFGTLVYKKILDKAKNHVIIFSSLFY